MWSPLFSKAAPPLHSLSVSTATAVQQQGSSPSDRRAQRRRKEQPDSFSHVNSSYLATVRPYSVGFVRILSNTLAPHLKTRTCETSFCSRSSNCSCSSCGPCARSPLSVSARSWCASSAPLLNASSTPPPPLPPHASDGSRSVFRRETLEDVTKLVLACMPRAPLFARAAALQRRVMNYEVTQLVSGLHVKPEADASAEAQPASPSTHQQQQRGDAGKGEGAARPLSASRDASSTPETAAGVAVQRAAIAAQRFDVIQSNYGSLRYMLMALAKTPLQDVDSATESAAPTKAAADVAEVNRGGGRYGVYLSCDLVFVTIAGSATEAGLAFQSAYAPLSASDRTSIFSALTRPPPTPVRAAEGGETARRAVHWQRASGGVRSGMDGVAELIGQAPALIETGFLQPEDFCYPFLSPNEKRTAWGFVVEEKNRLLTQVLQPRDAKGNDELTELYSPYFGDDFTPPPPPEEAGGLLHAVDRQSEASSSPASAVAKAKTTEQRGPRATALSAKPSPAAKPSSSPNIFTPSHVRSLLPTYFVPISALLAQLPPGYTADHVRAIFRQTGAVEVVQLGNSNDESNTFVRFHGGKLGEGFAHQTTTADSDSFNFDDGDVEAEEDNIVVSDTRNETVVSRTKEAKKTASDSLSSADRQLQRYITSYKPDPFLFYAFRPRFAAAYQWMSLYDVVQFAPAAVQRRLLPLQQQQTLLYFAQMQHVAQFTPANGGGVARCAPPARSLREETTPLPRVLAEVAALLTNRGVVYVEELERELAQPLSDYAKRHILAYFGTLRRFLYQHESRFRLSVFASPATLYEAAAAKAKAKAEQGEGKGEYNEGKNKEAASADRQVVQSVSDDSDGSASNVAASAEQSVGKKHHDNIPSKGIASTTVEEGKAAVSLSPPPLPASLPRPGAGFISIPQPFHDDSKANSLHATHNKMNNSNSNSSAALSDDLLPGITPADALLDADGFPCWLQARDLAVQLEEEAQMRDRHQASLEVQLEFNESGRNLLRRRKLRRRLAAQADPNSPYCDPAVLLDAIVRYLPERRHVALKVLLEALPASMRDFLPNDPVGLFRNNPEKVQLFEYRRVNHLRVMRPNVPLPDGRLRSTYTVEELLHLCAAQLPHGVSKTVVHIFGYLPYGARETVRLQHRHLVHLLERFPEYFVVIYPDAQAKQKHMARVTLLRMPPPAPTFAADDAALTEVMTQEEAEAVEVADRELLLAELPPELRQSLDTRRDA